MKLDEFEAIVLPRACASAKPWPKQPAGLVLSRNNPPMPPVASTTRPVSIASGPSAVAASTPLMALSSTIRPRASTPSSRVIDGQRRSCDQRTHDLAAGTVTGGVHDAVAAVRGFQTEPPSAIRAAVEGNAKPCQMFDRGGAASTIRPATASSQSPAPAAIVSARCRAGASSSPMAAASPPCANRLDASAPSGALTATAPVRGELQRRPIRRRRRR